ncbi:multidrug effflux MFS transporter [Thiofilum flexile]|uniref:multidrug effflux MFS transporter n=1 Tax=Thiofilum flexile TaxID=125627 RepID=UPI00037960DB|nr:multidrug effflux MFS transporter [Thiofilum flexile]
MPHSLSLKEFIILIALLTSLPALAIDAMLPAFQQMGIDLKVTHANDIQLVIPVLFLGLSIGQLVFGPLSDSWGRKLITYWGLGIFMLGSAISLFAQDFNTMLVGRFLQGLGAAAPRVVSIAIVRDLYSGRQMAQIMSFTMTVFILVPAIAPLLGQGILVFASWHAIFALFLVTALIVTLWYGLRLEETLKVENRRPFSMASLWQAAKEVFTNKVAMGYTLGSGLIFGAFMGYINSSPQIFQQQYNLGEQFPFYFGALALSLGAASLLNAKLVMKYGMRLLSTIAIRSFTILALIFVVIAYLYNGHPPLWQLMTYLLLSFFSVGLLFGNLNSLAMEPLGHIAGIGAAIIGSVSSLFAIPLGTIIGQSYNGTVLPIVIGFSVLGLLTALTLRWTRSHTKA